MNTLLRALALAAALAAAGCAELAERAPGERVEFEFTARFAARYGGEAASGQLAWRHDAARDEVLISSPFGQGLARVTRQAGHATLVMADDRRYSAADAETLTEEVLGFRLPLRGLADWVRARPSADAPARIERGPDGQLALLEQQGWRVEYQAFDGGGRPERMRLHYPGLELRLAISQWK
ncbi:MAG: lipoprotein insertase outer membrane protein LolB [Betaproteobacteria bacterium]|nr:lipoprotein insertase outer membrane protein LolB [Betaproteobacteria bacterium]MDH5221796.1 lipoprotein insertase outer membrane protein LolB [Betaproteobacteria bacterium]MDH5349224.1 lipoprotein insertase outer membrane protein LolB [Betaproteobacteria bacterium]